MKLIQASPLSFKGPRREKKNKTPVMAGECVGKKKKTQLEIQGSKAK